MLIISTKGSVKLIPGKMQYRECSRGLGNASLLLWRLGPAAFWRTLCTFFIEPGYEAIREVGNCEQTSRGRVADDVSILALGLQAAAVRVPSVSRRCKVEITIDY